MSNLSKGNDSMIFIYIGTIVVSITLGILSWNWIEPESFGGRVWWLLVWGFLSYVGHIIIGLIVFTIAEYGKNPHPISPIPNLEIIHKDYPLILDTKTGVIKK